MKRAFAGAVARCGWGLIAAAAMAAPSAGAITLTPEDIVRHLYADYIAITLPPRQSPFGKIAAYASRSFAKAADREAQCENNLYGNCALDFDVLSEGQCGGQVIDLLLERSTRPNGVTVRADFNVNCGYPNDPLPRDVSFLFIQEDGAWKIDDIGPGMKEQIQSYDYARYSRPRR